MAANNPKIVKALISGTGWPIDGHEVYLARWDYDPEYFHLFMWEKETDEAAMLTIYQTETDAGLCLCGSLEEFTEVWKAGEYETNCALRISPENVQVLEDRRQGGEEAVQTAGEYADQDALASAT